MKDFLQESDQQAKRDRKSLGTKGSESVSAESRMDYAVFSVMDFESTNILALIMEVKFQPASIANAVAQVCIIC